MPSSDHGVLGAYCSSGVANWARMGVGHLEIGAEHVHGQQTPPSLPRHTAAQYCTLHAVYHSSSVPPYAS
eukprot:3940398-Rhodomonas_salina.2